VPYVRLRDPHVLGEAARVQVRRLERGAHRFATPAAVVTDAARHVVGRHDAIADREAGYAGAERRHLADHLVAEYRRDLRRGITELGDIRAAETAALEPQQRLTRTDGRPGPVLGGEVGGARVDRGPHAARAAVAEPDRRPAAERDRELAAGRHRDALLEHAEPAGLDLVEQRPVDAPHDLRRHQRAGVSRRPGVSRGPVELPGPRRLVAHEAHELVAVASGPQILRGHSELPEVFLRNIHAAGAGVGADVAHDVRELERRAEVHRVLARARIRVAEDLDAAETDRGG